jgi:hypothetical protein
MMQDNESLHIIDFDKVKNLCVSLVKGKTYKVDYGTEHITGVFDRYMNIYIIKLVTLYRFLLYTFD